MLVVPFRGLICGLVPLKVLKPKMTAARRFMTILSKRP